VERTLKFWGWGHEDEGLCAQERSALVRNFTDKLNFDLSEPLPTPRVEDIVLAPPRISPPDSLSHLCSVAPYQRLLHTYGQSFPDSVRTFARNFANAPDLVAFPGTEEDISALFDWAATNNIALIPFGGGSSVVGGVEPAVGTGYDGCVSLDMTCLNRVLEIDDVSLAANIQGGALGPTLEGQLKPAGLTLRHFPQSFEHSTLGGWLATRSGGHFATLYTHIDDLVESVRLVTPSGVVESRRLPGSGAGPSPDRLFLGSEGALGIITQAWMRVQRRPRFKATASVKFSAFFDAARAVRAISQAGLFPANVRIVDGVETLVNGASDGSFTLLVVSFESADHPVIAWMKRALECCTDHAGIINADWETNPKAHLEGEAGAWREAFIRMPFNREILTPLGIISDTFETSITWERFENFYAEVKHATQQAIRDVTGKDGAVSCRFSHAYPDGPAPYFGFHAQGTPARLLEQWQAIKDAASDAVISKGGTITHHHAVGRDHLKWYEQQRPALFGDVLAAAKRKLDPEGVLNPGVLIPLHRDFDDA